MCYGPGVFWILSVYLLISLAPFPLYLSAQLSNCSSSTIRTPVLLYVLPRLFCHSGLVNVPTSRSDASLFLSVCSTVLSKFAYRPVYFIPVLPLFRITSLPVHHASLPGSPASILSQDFLSQATSLTLALPPACHHLRTPYHQDFVV